MTNNQSNIINRFSVTNKGNGIPMYIKENLNPQFELRPYQIEAFDRFITTSNEPHKINHFLFHMATGSGKTLIMAGCILHLYQLGYRHFIFFVNSSTIIEKTKDNFLNSTSSKYLFAENIIFSQHKVNIVEVENFQTAHSDDINIVFCTIQALHSKLNAPKENSITFEDFDDSKIVLISDEAHHINAETKKGKLKKEEAETIESWENTVTQIFDANDNNYLLEFTATVDLKNPQIFNKYKDKLLFDYPLKQFRLDKYSKDVKVLQADVIPFQRALQAILLSQYRKKVFESHGLNIKPVILFKSKTIAESQDFYKEFLDKISQLMGTDLENIKNISKENIISEAFRYFENKGLEMSNLAIELQEDFSEIKCLIVDSKSDNEQKQLTLNSLESENNICRSIFAVDKLNEGWDVLNLFDIVRLYDNKDSDSNGKKISNTTMSEAQLIGRGARYCPFVVAYEQNKYERKYDDDIQNPLRICEELYYHAAYNPKYVAELTMALVDIGIQENNINQTRSYPKIKQTKKDNILTLVQNNTIQKILKKQRSALVIGHTVQVSHAFEINKVELNQPSSFTYNFKDIYGPVKQKAIQKLEFYQFNNLKHYFPQLKSIRQFIESDDYLNSIKIDIYGAEQIATSLTNIEYLNITISILEEISKEIQSLTSNLSRKS